VQHCLVGSEMCIRDSSCPWRECKTKKTTEFLRLFPMNWEAQTSAVGKSE
jgi:hypothetical protein